MATEGEPAIVTQSAVLLGANLRSCGGPPTSRVMTARPLGTVSFTSRCARSAVTHRLSESAVKAMSCGAPGTSTLRRISPLALRIETRFAGGLETATYRPSRLATALWGPAGTRSLRSTRQGGPVTSATAPSASSATKTR
jgi:hypothetical protein